VTPSEEEQLKRIRITVSLVVATLLAGVAAAKDPIVTDRPDFTESALTVGRNTLQLEGGSSYADDGETSLTSLGELLVRFGVSRSLELRLETLSYLWLSEPGDSRSGFVDSSIGVKFQLNDGGGSGFWGRTQAGVIVASFVPTGSSAFRQDSWLPKAVLAMSWDLSDSVSIGTNLGWARPEEDDRRYNSIWLSAVAGVGVAPNTSLFFELFGFDRERPSGPNTVTFQTGVAYLLSPDLQLDARAARRLTDEGPDLLLGVGVSWRR
jgi:hypothetical protein